MIRFELNKGGSKIGIEKILKKLGKIVFKEFKKGGIISVAFVSGAKIKGYNKKYRRKDKATDILTFVLNPVRSRKQTQASATSNGVNEKDCLGEIILSPADIKKRAIKSKKSVAETAVYLIIHGVCHVFGLTHYNAGNAKKMETEEKKILEQL